jgi:thiamine phosphate synthase YjbQ (UPF0047 family)
VTPQELLDQYRHNHTDDDSNNAHPKRHVMGRERIAKMINARLDFGPWE